MENVIVLYPSPGRGHLVTMVELGRLIVTHYPSFSISLVIPTAPFEASSSSTAEYIATVSAATPSITFHHLPSVSLPNTFSSPADVPALLYQLVELSNPNLHRTLIEISRFSNIKAFVIDFFCSASSKVSSELNIPTYYYFTSGGNGLANFLYHPTFHKNTTESFKDLGNANFECPGCPPIPVKDMPVALRDRNSKVYQYFIDTGIHMMKSDGLIVNSFDLLEERAFKSIMNGECAPGEKPPPVYCVGPVIGEKSGENVKEEHECLSWLDSQPSRSVLFLSFGSLGVFYSKQLKEIAVGLERSGVRFLWVVRTPPPDDEIRRKLVAAEPGIESFLPEGFLEKTKDRGFVVRSWAPQVDILSHDSVGGFVTHCGWNSILEGVCAGVPMLAWPLYAEQKMIKVFVVEEMKVAFPVTQSNDGSVSATELEKRVTELMYSEKGRAVRERVVALRDAAAAAMRDGGSSRVALDKLAESFKRGRREVEDNGS